MTNNNYEEEARRHEEPKPEPITEGRSAKADTTLPRKRGSKKKILLASLVVVVGVALLAGYLFWLVRYSFRDESSTGPVARPSSSAHRESKEPGIGDYQSSLAAQRAKEQREKLAAQNAQDEEAKRKQDADAKNREEADLQRQANEYANSAVPSSHGNSITPDQRRFSGDVVLGGDSGVSAADADKSGTRRDMATNDHLRSERYEPGRAQVLRQEMLLRRGTVIPCIIQNRVVSDYEGLSSCVITQDVYSADGKTVLIERGSVAYGEQKVAMAQGIGRLYMQWGQIDTPKGVRVDIDSLGIDNLGASGIKAWVDTHFWDRFGNSIMLSFIDDGMEALASQMEKQRNSGVTFDNSSHAAEKMAEIALRDSINIKPTGYVNQGTRMMIRVARDVDFSNVYELTP